MALSVKDPVSVNFDDLASEIRELGTGTVEFLARKDLLLGVEHVDVGTHADLHAEPPRGEGAIPC